MKKILLISFILLLTSFKNFQTESTYINFDYELKYQYHNTEISVFVSKENSKDFIRYEENYSSYILQRNDILFNIKFSNNEIDYNFSRIEPNRGYLPELLETKETKIINKLVCTKFIEKPSSEPEPKEVYICKDQKINNANFLVTMGLRVNPEIKGLIVEINSTKKSTKEITKILSFKEIKRNQKSLKINDENLNKILKQFTDRKKHSEDSEFIKEHENDIEYNTIYNPVENKSDKKQSNNLPLKAEKKYINIAEKNYKSSKYKDGNLNYWNEYATKHFKFKTKEGSGITYQFTAYCKISKKGVITEISNVKPEEYKEDYINFLNSVKDKWIPAEEYGEKIESSINIMVKIVK